MGSVTSVSLSDEFKELMMKYNFSPTEAIRRGIAVMLCDLGVREYINPLNVERLEFTKKFIASIESTEKMNKIKKLLDIK